MMRRKTNIVYFLGAGCSKNFGFPLTGDIMPEIFNNLKANNLFQLGRKKESFEKQQEIDLKRFLGLLYPGLKDIDFETEKTRIPSIVEVLSLVDHLCFYNLPPHPELNEENLIYLRYLLNRAVAELMMDYQNAHYEGRELALLEAFMEPIISAKNKSNVTIITTNYDLSIDPTFEEALLKNQIDYGISFRDPESGEIISQPQAPLFKYFKLHGSLNWLKCDLCGQYYIYPNGVIVHQAFKENIDDGNTCVCNDYLRLKSVLISPSLVRDIRDPNLLQIWKASSESIRTADKLVFIGYSLPAEDFAIKALIMRGINGRGSSPPLSIDVVQCKKNAESNYINLFGKSIKKYYENGLPQYLKSKVQHGC